MYYFIVKGTNVHLINITLLVLCHSDMFQPSKGHFQGVHLIHYHSKMAL